MRKMLPFCCLEMKPLFNMEAFFNLPRCFAQWAVTLQRGRRIAISVGCGQDGSSWVMLWASEGPAGFGHSQIHAGIQHRWFLQERIFVFIVTLVP